MVLYELHENSIYYIEKEEWDKALVLLQKAQIIIEVIRLYTHSHLNSKLMLRNLRRTG